MQFLIPKIERILPYHCQGPIAHFFNYMYIIQNILIYIYNIYVNTNLTFGSTNSTQVS